MNIEKPKPGSKPTTAISKSNSEAPAKKPIGIGVKPVAPGGAVAN